MYLNRIRQKQIYLKKNHTSPDAQMLQVPHIQTFQNMAAHHNQYNKGNHNFKISVYKHHRQQCVTRSLDKGNTSSHQDMIYAGMLFQLKMLILFEHVTTNVFSKNLKISFNEGKLLQLKDTSIRYVTTNMFNDD